MRAIKKIHVEFIPHHKQRYKTSGDFFFDTRNPHLLHVRVSRHKNPLVQWLILIHEIVEMFLVLKRNIPFEEIDRFDMSSEEEDPGSQADAPYHAEHMVALEVEHRLAKEVGVTWGSY